MVLGQSREIGCPGNRARAQETHGDMTTGARIYRTRRKDYVSNEEDGCVFHNPVPVLGGQSENVFAKRSTLRQMPRIEFARLEIRRLGSWIWQVHENQSYLGRMIIRLNRPETLSLSQSTSEEWLSLHENIRAFEKLLLRLFSPDRFNYAQMGNVYPQLHVQAVPRYASKRVWNGRAFYDKKWGENWAPTPRSPLTLNETYQFAHWLRSEVQKDRAANV